MDLGKTIYKAIYAEKSEKREKFTKKKKDKAIYFSFQLRKIR